MEIIKHVNENTGKVLDSDTLQATVTNTIVIYPKDTFGNNIVDVFSLQFFAKIIQSDNTELEFLSFYNGERGRYEISVIPTLAGAGQTMHIIQTDSAEIGDSPFTIDIIPGPYDLLNSDLEEHFADPLNP